MTIDGVAQTSIEHINTMPVRFTDQELDDIMWTANERGVDLFELMRAAVLNDLYR